MGETESVATRARRHSNYPYQWSQKLPPLHPNRPSQGPLAVVNFPASSSCVPAAERAAAMFGSQNGEGWEDGATRTQEKERMRQEFYDQAMENEARLDALEGSGARPTRNRLPDGRPRQFLLR